MYRIKAFLSPADRLVKFDEIFEGTKNGFLNLIQYDIQPHAQERFSYGTIYGGEMIMQGEKGLAFRNGGCWKFATIDHDLMFKVYEGIARNDDFAFGMGIDSVEKLTSHFISGQNFVMCHPGVVLRKFKQEGGVQCLTIFHEEDEFMRELEDHTRKKVARIAPNLDHQSIRIKAVNGEIYRRKSALVEGSFHIFNEGVFSIDADKDVLEHIACVGLGDLTYLGFGHVSQVYDPRNKRTDGRQLRPNEIQKFNTGYVRGEAPQPSHDRHNPIY